MPRRSRKRHAPEPRDYSNEIDRDAALEVIQWWPWLEGWEEMSIEERLERALGSAEEISNESVGYESYGLRFDFQQAEMILGEVMEPSINLDSDFITVFLTWFYQEIIEDPKSVPTPEISVNALIDLTNQYYNQEYYKWFQRNKYHVISDIASNIAWGMRGRSPDLPSSIDFYLYASRHGDDLAGEDVYDPLSLPFLRKMVKLVVNTLEMNHHPAGLGPFDAEALQEIFKPRELLCLYGCARHWENPDEWPWQDVADHLGLGSVMKPSAISKEAVKIRKKLINYPRLRRALGLYDYLLDWA